VGWPGPWDLSRGIRSPERDLQDEGAVGRNNRHLGARPIVGPATGSRSTSRSGSIRTRLRHDQRPFTDSPPGAWVQRRSREDRGAVLIGRDTPLFRANVRAGPRSARIGIGARSRVDVTDTRNKYHEGFLGHAYIGEWVAPGPITSTATSDLRKRLRARSTSRSRATPSRRLRPSRLLVGDTHPDGYGEHASHTGKAIGRDGNVSCRRASWLTQAHPVVTSVIVRPGRPRVSRSISSSRPPERPFMAAGARSSPRPIAKLYPTFTSRPARTRRGPSRRATTTGRNLDGDVAARR